MMKMLTFSVWLLLLLAENYATRPSELVSKLMEVLPNKTKLFSLWQPLNLTPSETYDVERIIFGNFTTNGTSGQSANLTFSFSNVVVPKPAPRNRTMNTYYTELTCDFHNKLSINQAVEPQDLEIRGNYNTTVFLQQLKELKTFRVKQFSGRVRRTMFVDNSDQTELFYLNEEVNIGKNDKNDYQITNAMGEVIREVKGKIVNNTDTSHLINKIDDFKHLFPFLSSCLSPANTTENRMLSQYTYRITNYQDAQKWRSFRIRIPEININGTTNFNWTQITASGSDNSSVRLNVITITNPLKGRFKWYYEKNGQKFENVSQFSMNNLKLKADLNYTDRWIVNNVTVDIGKITIRKAQATGPDVNKFAHDILNEYVRSLIVIHYEQLMYQTYSKEGASKVLNDLGIEQLLELEQYYKKAFTPSPLNPNISAAQAPFFARWNDPHPHPQGFNRSKISTVTTPTKPANFTSLSLTAVCVDTRRWWQKLFIRNKCKGNRTSQVSTSTATITQTTQMSTSTSPVTQTSQVSTLTTSQAPSSNSTPCVDTRRWWQIPFKRNPCK